MRIKDLLDPKSIKLNGVATDKNDAIHQLVDLMVASDKISDCKVYEEGVHAREEESTTAVGEGIAIPHCKSDSVKKPGLAAMTIPAGVDYDAPDDEKVTLAFLIAAPNSKENIHVDVLSKLSVLLLDDEFTSGLRNAKTKKEFIEVIDKAEMKKDAEDAEERLKEMQNTKVQQILAVTACPTGIAHTYMAEEQLKKQAAAVGCTIKVETRGQGGTKNELTAKEIEDATCIIVAADTKVPMDRFDGKRVIQCQVADGINKAKELIDDALKGNVSVYRAAQGSKSTGTSEIGKESKGHVIYKHLMNGVSHMLPFVVGGGILIAIAFLIDGALIDMNSLSIEARSGFGSITPLASIFKTIGGGAFSFMLPILAGFIAMSIADRPGLAAGFVGGYIASTGTSGFLGALVVGFAAGYFVLWLKHIFRKIPQSLDGLKPILFYPLLSILAVGLFMIFLVEPFVGAINTALNSALSGMSGSSSIILGIIVGGMMAVDMGGPVNKAAYVFGTASIVAGNYNIMAAVMVGGMTPPLAIALSTFLFKNKFTTQERKAGPANIIMGLSFITEGAIPYAAADPLHVLPSCIVGSALAGAISMAANCTLMAPHGGIFVFPVVGNVAMYLVALIAGSIASAVLLGVTKKTVVE
jgi:PTS system fructose-specific IIC component